MPCLIFFAARVTFGENSIRPQSCHIGSNCYCMLSGHAEAGFLKMEGPKRGIRGTVPLVPKCKPHNSWILLMESFDRGKRGNICAPCPQVTKCPSASTLIASPVALSNNIAARLCAGLHCLRLLHKKRVHGAPHGLAPAAHALLKWEAC